VIVEIANEQGASRTSSDTNGGAEKRGCAETIQKGGSGATRNSSHGAKRGDLADTVIVEVRHKEVAIGCKEKVVWAIKCSRGVCAIRP
jgi:hypothetical protein